jgi:hypothetical protein
MKRRYGRDFPHHVVLGNCRAWRRRHASHALSHLRAETDWRWWTEGSDLDGTLVDVWGFADLERAIWFGLWASSSGIDWSVAPDQQPQESRPPLPPEPPAGPGQAVYRVRGEGLPSAGI